MLPSKGCSVILINLTWTSSRSSSQELNIDFYEMNSSNGFLFSGATPLPAAVTTAWMSLQPLSGSCLTRLVTGNEITVLDPIPVVQWESIWGHSSPPLLHPLYPPASLVFQWEFFMSTWRRSHSAGWWREEILNKQHYPESWFSL